MQIAELVQCAEFRSNFSNGLKSTRLQIAAVKYLPGTVITARYNIRSPNRLSKGAKRHAGCVCGTSEERRSSNYTLERKRGAVCEERSLKLSGGAPPPISAPSAPRLVLCEPSDAHSATTAFKRRVAHCDTYSKFSSPCLCTVIRFLPPHYQYLQSPLLRDINLRNSLRDQFLLRPIFRVVRNEKSAASR